MCKCGFNVKTACHIFQRLPSFSGSKVITTPSRPCGLLACSKGNYSQSPLKILPSENFFLIRKMCLSERRICFTEENNLSSFFCTASLIDCMYIVYGLLSECIFEVQFFMQTDHCAVSYTHLTLPTKRIV